MHRFSLRKTKSDNSQQTEWENRQAQGYNRMAMEKTMTDYNQEIIEFISSNPRNTWNRAVRKKPEWMNWLTKTFSNVPTLNEKLWQLHLGINSRPLCQVEGCHKEVNWINDERYAETCSYTCSQKLRKQQGLLSEIQNKIAATNLAKYGHTSANGNLVVQERRFATMMKKYGAKVSPKTVEAARSRAPELNEKARRTLHVKYGVDNIQQVPEIRAKTVNTFQERYGVTNSSSIPAVKEKKTAERQARWDLLFSNLTVISESVPIELRQTMPYANLRLDIKCNKCGFEETLPSETIKYRHAKFGSACTQCCDISASRSLDESLIANLIKELGINVVCNNRSIIYPQEIDIWLPDQKIAIEYCGLYWHGESRGKFKDYHIGKMNACTAADVRLITIFEDEWHHRSDVVCSRLRNLLGETGRQIMARKCIVKEIDSKEANAFCDKNHLQGAGRTKHAIGLYQDDTLVSCMTFSKLNIAKGRKHKEGLWELSRFCSLINTNVIGGASKLFNYFITNYNPEEIISYADLRWNNGNVYEKLGFTCNGCTSPNYWYIDLAEIKRIHRYGLRKNNTDNKELTEWENRRIAGWDRIWDCGNTRWVWSKK